MVNIVYFSSVSGNTKRFVEKLDIEAIRIPLYSNDSALEVSEAYVLIVPTYGGGPNDKAVPKQVIKFLNNKNNRELIRGVISAGNTNFGEAYCLAGDIIAKKCDIPHLYRFELFGTEEDVIKVKQGLENFWKQQPK